MNKQVMAGFGGAPQGQIRELSLVDRLVQASNLVAGGQLNHPIHGRLFVSQSRAKALLSENPTSAQLIRFKRSLFVGD